MASSSMDAHGSMLASLPDSLTIAREHALLGAYDLALIYYEGVCSGVQKHIRALAQGMSGLTGEEAEREKERWTRAREELGTEVKLVRELIKELQTFKHAPAARDSSGGSSKRGTSAVDSLESHAHAAPADNDRAPGSARHRPAAAPGPVSLNGAVLSNHAPPLKRVPSASAAPAAASPAPAHAPAWAPKATPAAAAAAAPGRASVGGKATGARAAAPAAAPAPGAAGGNYAGARGRVVTKPPVPRIVSGAAKPAAGAAAAAGGKDGKPKFSEVHTVPADKELIHMIENDIFDVNPNVSFDAIAGLGDAKGLIQEAVTLPILIPNYFQGIRRPWRGVLLFGPPGTGKTMLAKAVATECGTTFFNVTASTLTSKWRGESERLVRLLFEMARYYAPSVIFFDEIDSLASARGKSDEHEASRRVKTELLVQMDGMSSLTSHAAKTDDEAAASGEAAEGATTGNKQVVVLAASNLPWELDDAFKRRFEKRIYIPLPSLPEREELFSICMRGVEMAPDVDMHALAEMTEGYSGADIAIVCRDAAMVPIRQVMSDMRKKGGAGMEEMRKMLADGGARAATAVPVAQAHFTDSLSKVSSSVGGADLKRYADWMQEFGSS